MTTMGENGATIERVCHRADIETVSCEHPQLTASRRIPQRHAIGPARENETAIARKHRRARMAAKTGMRRKPLEDEWLRVCRDLPKLQRAVPAA